MAVLRDHSPAPTLVVLAAGRACRYGAVKPLAPVGPAGEAVIDLLADDASAAGFARLVLVVSPATGPMIREHVAHRWPSDIEVAFAEQSHARGTAPATLAARPYVDPRSPFAVSNADDVYGRPALRQLAEHLAAGPTSCLVGYRLDRSLVGEDPVSRGICQTDGSRLTVVTERRQVRRAPAGFTAADGLEPANLDPASIVSMNLWGFRPEAWTALAAAIHDTVSDDEVLLPVVVADLLTAGRLSIDVLPTEEWCVGVTHPGDLEPARLALREQIASGRRPAHLFTGHMARQRG